MRRILLFFLVCCCSLPIFAQTKHDFTTAPTIEPSDVSIPSWTNKATVTIGGVSYILEGGGNGSFTHKTTGGVNNSGCLQKDGSGGDLFTLRRADGQPFKFYGINVSHQSMNHYEGQPGVGDLPPWYTITYTSPCGTVAPDNDMTPLTPGRTPSDHTRSNITYEKDLRVTSVQIYFKAIIFYWIDDIIVGPANTDIAAPTAKTGTATVNGLSATLRGELTPNGIATNASFEYGLSTAYGSTIDVNTFTASFCNANTSRAVSGLEANKLYHYRLKAVNTQGTGYGEDRLFSTYASPTIGSAEVQVGSIGVTSANLLATLYGGNNIEFGERGFVYSATSGVNIANGTKKVSGSGLGDFTAGLTNLAANTTYYVKSYAIYNGGVLYGEEISFTTNAITQPSISEISTSVLSDIQATLAIKINPNGAITTVVAEYGSTSSYGTPLPLSTSSVPETSTVGILNSVPMLGLIPNTTYFVRVVATNSVGSTTHTSFSFKTKGIPSVGNTTAANITRKSASLASIVTYNGGAGAYRSWFCLWCRY